MTTISKIISLNDFVPGLASQKIKKSELAQTSFRPTVLIFIGGSGAKVAKRLKKLLRQLFPDEMLDIFQMLVIDTTSQDMDDGDDPLDPGEFVYLGPFDAADMIRHLDDNEHLARWWPGGLERPYRPTFSGTGANRVRAVGRQVISHYMGSLIIPRLEAKIDRAIEVNAQHGMGATSLKFYIVCSLAGGTGSGMVLDLAYVARMLGLQRQPTAYITGVLVTDDPFRPKAKTANTAATFSANTYAAMMEINHFSKTRTFRERYNDLISTEDLPEKSFRPFDVAYLLGLHNSGGQALDSFESLADMIAAEMLVEIASKLQGHTTNVLDNVQSNENFIAGQPAAFSSFALSSLVYPLPGIASWCALKGFANFSDQVLLQPSIPASDVEADVIAFTQKAGVEEEIADRLIERLAIDEKNEQITLPLLSHDLVSGLSEDQLLGTLQRLEERAQAQLAQIRETIAGNVQPIERLYSADLKAETGVLLRDVERGPRYLSWFMSGLSERLAEQRDDQMVGEQSIYRATVEAQQLAWRTAKADLAKALRMSRATPWRGRAIKNSRDTYVASFNAYLEAIVELDRRSQAILCLNTFISETRQLARQANDLINDWEKLNQVTGERADAAASQERATTTEYSLMHNIVGGEELQKTYESHFPEVDEPTRREHLVSQFWSYFKEHVPDWSLAGGSPGKPEDGSPAVQAYYFLANYYTQQLESKALLERLQEIYGDDWQREIELRYNQTVPFWNYNLARFSDRILNNLQHEPSLVGYGEENTEAWTDMVEQASGDNVDGVNNKNKHEMLFLRTSHGLPLFALRTIVRMRRDYEYMKRLWEEADPNSNPIPVHISREWEAEMGDIGPVESPPVVEAEAEAEPSANGNQPRPEPAA